MNQELLQLFKNENMAESAEMVLFAIQSPVSLFYLTFNINMHTKYLHKSIKGLISCSTV